nr:conjugative transfer protein MobI(A/C) [uncultured Vibrio sp.]
MKSISAIQDEIDSLYEESKYLYEYWMRKIADREVKRLQRRDKKERTHYQLSLEFHGSSFRTRWIHVQFIKHNERIIRVAKPIAVPRNNKYGSVKFKYAEPWELDLICKIEEVLYPIRVKKSALMKAHQTLIKTNKFLNVGCDISMLKQRVSPTMHTIAKYKQSYSS